MNFTAFIYLDLSFGFCDIKQGTFLYMYLLILHFMYIINYYMCNKKSFIYAMPNPSEAFERIQSAVTLVALMTLKEFCKKNLMQLKKKQSL